MPDATSVDPGALVLPEEIELLRKISEFPDLVERAGESREPHHVAYYARDVAGLWNSYVQDGTRHRVLSDDAALTNSRLGLVLAVRTVLAGHDIIHQDYQSAPAITLQALVEAVNSGRIPVAQVDASVSRTLAVKRWLGLFENPQVGRIPLALQ